MSAQEQRTIGPKNFLVACPAVNVLGAELSLEKMGEVSVNDAPRAQQAWRIENVFFTFPNAFKHPDETTVTAGMEFEFEIKMFIGGVEVASQKFLEFGKFGEEKSPFHVLGSLEPFRTATVYAGQDVRFQYRVFKNATKGSVGSEAGQVVVNYSLVTA